MAFVTSCLHCQQITKYFSGHRVLDSIDLAVRSGEFLTLLGPSGCGKTTLLRIIAGLESADSGTLLLQGKQANQLPPADRPLHVVFQQYALFPHMTVYDNVAFGLLCAGTPAAQRASRVTEALQRVSMADFSNKKPDQLSGGQQQRVAVARAIVLKPKLLLLDEPLSALDHHLRKKMRLELKNLQRELGITFMMVTHNQEEALTLSDRIAILNNGSIEQIATPREIYEKPSSLFVAQFIGEINVFQATNNTRVAIRPEDIAICRLQQTEKQGENHAPATIIDTIYKGATVEIVASLKNGGEVIVTEPLGGDNALLKYKRGEPVVLTWQNNRELRFPHE
jgi:spermidine/putrescine transport system ATP-binding protein